MKNRILSCILAAAMTVIMTVTLTACTASSGGGQSPASGADQKPTSGSGAGSSAETSTEGNTDITFVLDWTPNTNHTGVYVAQALGYFEEEGLNVTIVQPPDDGAEVLVASGNAQFGVSFQDTMMPAVTGSDPMPITAVAAILQHNTSGIISLKEKGIKSPADMEGHTYATWDLDIEKATIKQVMEDEGGNFDNLTLIPSTVTDEPTALASDMVDCIWVFYGWAGIACEVAGLDTNYFSFEEIDPVFDYYTPVIIGNTDWMAENPDTAKAFMSAVSKGYTHAAENPSEAADILLKAVPELDETMVRASQEYMADHYIADAAKWGVIDQKRWNGFYEWISKMGLSEAEIPADTGYTNEYLG